MELYIFNKDRQLSGVVESYEYLRWTRRYSRTGSFELLAIATDENIALLKEGNILHKSDDAEAGIIERVELSQTEREIVTASGRFATGILARRIIWGTETLSGDLGAAVRQLVNNHFLSPADTARKITGFAYSAPTFGLSVSTQTSYKNLMEAVCDLCEGLGVGIKTVFNPATGLFTFTLYAGVASSAVFSKEYENLIEQTYIESVDDYANTALVGGEGEGAARQFVTIAQGTGENRREVFVDAKDLQSADFPQSYTEALTFRGQTRLSELVPRYSFDTGVNPHGNLRYKTDFDLGHTVKVISKPWGVAMTARITEIEETYDADGLSLSVTFGKAELTLAQKMRSDMSGMKTSILAPGGGGSGEIPDNSVTTAKLANEAVTTAKIAAGAVTATEIADNAVTSAKIAAGAVATTDIADLAVTAAKIANSTITGGKIASLTVATGNIADSAVTSAKIADGAVATADLADLTVTAAKIANSTITSGKIASSGVASTNIASGAVTMAKIASASDTSFTYTEASGVTVNMTNCVCYNTVVHIYIRVNITTAVASGGTIITITNSNFQPPVALSFNINSMSATVAGFRGNLSTSGVISNGNSSATGLGYFDIAATYTRKN